MVKGRTWFTLFILSLGTVAATASCGSDEATGSAGASGVSGGSIISGGGRAGGAVGRAGSSTGGGSSVSQSALGIECTTDAQCGDGLVCAKANGTAFGDGGPSKGMCTMSCVPGGLECDALQAGAECFNFGTTAAPQGYCLASCVQDDPVDLNSKCSGRTDFVCVDLGTSGPAPFCLPHCLSDADCGSGLFCDKTSLLGLCSKTKPPAGDPVGSPCTPSTSTTTAPNTCAGYCIRTSDDGVTPPTGLCLELCSVGFPCMYGSGSKPTPGGFCGGKLGATTDPFGALDLGYCLPNCSCSGDCKFPGDLCRKWPSADAALASELGADGVCYPVVADSVELSCGEGGAGGSGGAAGEAGAAGSTPSAGGASSGAGGASSGAGGATSGTGGATSGTGGATSGTGGATSGTGGH
ncbi:MAG: hypothetical protein WDO74_16090 [Pseudomonadota bacterium]